MARSIRILLLAIVAGLLSLPSFAPAAPAGACGGVAPETVTCTNRDIQMTTSVLANHGSSVPVTPAYVGRLRSTISWKEGTLTGSRSFYCDYQTNNDYVNGAATPPTDVPPNCKGEGSWPPGISNGKCVDTAPECNITWIQTCKATAYKLDTGKGAGPWECDTLGA